MIRDHSFNISVSQSIYYGWCVVFWWVRLLFWISIDAVTNKSEVLKNTKIQWYSKLKRLSTSPTDLRIWPENLFEYIVLHVTSKPSSSDQNRPVKLTNEYCSKVKNQIIKISGAEHIVINHLSYTNPLSSSFVQVCSRFLASFQ